VGKILDVLLKFEKLNYQKEEQNYHEKSKNKKLFF